MPDLASSTNASSSNNRVGCVAGTMAQDPITEKAVRLARAFRIHMGSVNGPNSQKNHPPQLVVQPPRLRQPRLVAGLEFATSAAVYHLRGSASHLSRAPLLLPSDLFGDLFCSFLHFLHTSTLLHGCYNSESRARNIEVSFGNLILVSQCYWACWEVAAGRRTRSSYC